MTFLILLLVTIYVAVAVGRCGFTATPRAATVKRVRNFVKSEMHLVSNTNGTFLFEFRPLSPAVRGLPWKSGLVQHYHHCQAWCLCLAAAADSQVCFLHPRQKAIDVCSVKSAFYLKVAMAQFPLIAKQVVQFANFQLVHQVASRGFFSHS